MTLIAAAPPRTARRPPTTWSGWTVDPDLDEPVSTHAVVDGVVALCGVTLMAQGGPWPPADFCWSDRVPPCPVCANLVGGRGAPARVG